jgi:hypothetical protein
VERPTRAKKNYRPAQVVFDYTTQRRTSEQIKADEAKAKADATAAESDAAALRKSQLERCAAIEDAMQAADNLQSLQDLRPDLHLKSASNTDVEPLSDSPPMLGEPVDAFIGPPVVERRSYRASSYSDDFLTGWEEHEPGATVGGENNEEQAEGLHEGEGEGEYEDAELSHSESEASGFQTQTAKPLAKTKTRGTRREERGLFRAAVNDARKVPPPPLPQTKKRKAPDPPPPVEVDSSAKRPKVSEPGGLVRNWKKSVGILEHIARKNPIEFIDSDEVAEGEFDKPEGSDMLSAVRASKKATGFVDHKLVCYGIFSYMIALTYNCTQSGVKIKSIDIYPAVNTHRSRAPKVTVDRLPFPYPRALHLSRWQKLFRPSLISWASSWQDPYATNTLLDEDVVLEIWDNVYPDIDLDKQERAETGVKLLHLVRVMLIFLTFFSFHLQGGNILHDWRTAIGTGALNVVKNHFLNPANGFDKERIRTFVQWGLEAPNFNFMYREPDAAPVSNCLIWLLLN